MEYRKILENRIQDYRTRVAADDIIDSREPFIELDWSQDNRPYFRQLVEHKIVTKKSVEDTVKRERVRARVAAELGEAPDCARDYARIFSRHAGVTITYKGRVDMKGRSQASILDLARSARLRAGELDLPFSRDAINDAVEDYYEGERDRALDKLRQRSNSRPFDWEALATACFDCRDGAPFVAAVLKSFVWQVKRKLHDLPIGFPLMPVIVGAQGKGKSYFVKRLTEPMEDVTSYSDFGALADDRNIDLWRSFIIVLDEMAKAAKSDIETIKHVITTDYLERRPMRTNSSVTIRQNATCIGTSNSFVVEIIKDETGNRRIVELRWSIDYREGGIDAVNFADAWASIQETDADPMADHRDTLAVVQAESRNHGPVEDWLRSLDCDDWSNLIESADRGFITTPLLYSNYLAHRVVVTGGNEPMIERRTQTQFANELARVISTETQYGIARQRTSRANGWKLTPPEPAFSILDREDRA